MSENATLEKKAVIKMKKKSKVMLSIILSATLLLGSVMGASAAATSASTEASVGETVGTYIANGLNTAFNKVVDSLLNIINDILPDSVNVKELSEHSSDNFYSGTDEFIDTAADDAKWSLGYSSASIVPDDFSTGKYYKGGYSLNVKLTEVVDDLRVRVIAINDGSGRGTHIFAVVDCLGLANADVRLIREELEEYADKNNIASINVSATHVHSGIDTQGIYTDIINSALQNLTMSYFKSDNLADAIDEDFRQLIIKQTAACVKEACESMTEGTLTYAHTDIADYIRDRTEPDVSIDEMYRLMFTPDDGSTGTIIANFSAHPERVGAKEDVASADFVYYMEEVINEAGYNFLYIQGAVGTITETGNVSDDGIIEDRIEGVKRYGQELAYILLGMTKTEEECIAEIVDFEREALAADSETYTAWYEDWEPVEEEVVEPILNIKIEEYIAPIDNAVYAALGKLSLANNEILKDGDTYYTSTEVGYMELGSNIKVILSPGETYAELIKGGSNMDDFEYDCAYDIMGTEDVLVFDLMNDAIGYIMPDDYFTYATIRYNDGITIDSSWGFTSLGEHAASNIYGAIYDIYASVSDVSYDTDTDTDDKGTTPGEDVAVDTVIDIGDVTIDTENKTITLNPETSVAVGKDFSTSGEIRIFDEDGNELDDDSLIGTGCKLQILDDDGNVTYEYDVVVIMDVDGNGKITAADARFALRCAAQLDTLEGVYALAADANSDGTIKPSDARIILRKAAQLD